MGKASRRIKNFLLGRKEKEKKKETTSSFPEEPFMKRWSYEQSLDSISATSLVAAATGVTTTRILIAAGLRRAAEDVAATRIQAAFRSYLARKALRALRALIKLQALVRGQLVRKQLATTLRRMHVLMEIQIRARFRRIEMPEESQLVLKSQLSRYGSLFLEKGFRKAHKEAIDKDLFERRHWKNRNRFKNHAQAERIRHGFTTYHSEDLSVSRRWKRQLEEFSATAHSGPLYSVAGLEAACGRASFNCQQRGYPNLPNYMLNSQSSKAKVNVWSQSEPKQRPRSSKKEREQLQLN
ncbi:hypothetical protein SLA2020_130370 [Shorea laevis]